MDTEEGILICGIAIPYTWGNPNPIVCLSNKVMGIGEVKPKLDAMQRLKKRRE